MTVRRKAHCRLVGWLVGGWFIVFNATFNNISVISWRSVLLVEETEYPKITPNLLKSLTNFIKEYTSP